MELLANENCLRISVKGKFAGGVFSVNAQEKIGFNSQLAAIQLEGYPVFTTDGKLSLAQSNLLRNPSLRGFIAQTGLRKGESLHFFTNAVHLYLIRPTESRVLAAIDDMVKLADPAELEVVHPNCQRLPAQFQGLLPLIEKWALDDDSERQDLLNRASTTSLRALVTAVDPYVQVIDSYLNSFGDNPLPYEACALGRLAECAVEAKRYLETTAR